MLSDVYRVARDRDRPFPSALVDFSNGRNHMQPPQQQPFQTDAKVPHEEMRKILCQLTSLYKKSINPSLHVTTRGRQSGSRGFTIVELMVVGAILGTLISIAVPLFTSYTEQVKVLRTIAEIRMLQEEVVIYSVELGFLPNSLAQIGRGNLVDSWGTPYQYLNIAGLSKEGKPRKDKFLVPLNSDFDLYSMGKDKQSKAPLAPKVSHDDIIRANNGRYVGLASEF